VLRAEGFCDYQINQYFAPANSNNGTAAVCQSGSFYALETENSSSDYPSMTPSFQQSETV